MKNCWTEAVNIGKVAVLRPINHIEAQNTGGSFEIAELKFAIFVQV